jgi:hypothetical protein
MGNAYKIIFRKLGKRHWTERRELEDNILIDLKDIKFEDVDWIPLVQDRNR